MDKYFVMRNSQEFLGLIGSRMIFSSQRARWEIVNSADTTKILAYMEAEEEDGVFPLGQQAWNFLDVACTDPAPATTRTLNFHLDVEQPGQFCCDSGACVDSELVCNNFPDCEAEWSTLIGPDQSRYCALIGDTLLCWRQSLCHNNTPQVP